MAAVSEVDEFCSWAQSRNVGCLFARAMFKSPDEYGISIQHISGTDSSDLAVELDSAVKKAIQDPRREAAAFVFDHNLPVIEYAKIFGALANRENWLIREAPATADGKDFVVVGLDTLVGKDQGMDVLSEIVGFAPYNYLPITRRAPAPAIVLRTKPTFSEDPLPERIERRANLAAIRLNIAPNAFTQLWNKSQALRAALDGKDNPMARARVALAFPSEVWAASQTNVAAPRNAKTSA